MCSWKPGIPKGGPGRPGTCFIDGGAPGGGCWVAPPPAEGGVFGFGDVVGFSLDDSVDFFPEGAGVDEAEDLPLLGLNGSFLALRSPFSFGGVRLSPFCRCAAAVAVVLLCS